MPIVSGSGGGPAGVSSATVIQTGNGTPYNVVTPTHKGSIFQDLTNGGVYIAAGTTTTSWMQVGGISDPSALFQPRGVSADTGLGQVLLANGSDIATITDAAALAGSQNGLEWDATGGDGNQRMVLSLGVAKLWVWAANGTTTFPGVVTAPGVKTQALTSGALPTVQLVSATGAQILTSRDADTITPCTFNPGAATTATVTVALSPDNVTYSTLGVETEPAGVAFDGTIHLIKVRVPAGWYLKLTVNAQAVLGLTTYY